MRHPFETSGKAVIAVLCFLFIFKCSTAQQNNPLVNSGDLLQKGNELHDQKKYKEAIALYKQISRSDTNYSSALYELSMSCEADSQLQAAHQYAMQGLRLFPEEFPKFSMQAANALDDMGKQEEAINLYDEALKKDPQSYILYFNKGVTQLRMEKLDDAKLNFQQCLLINPYYSSAHYFLGNIYLNQGNLVPAMLAYKTYLLVAPTGKYMSKCVNNLSAIAKVSDDVLEIVKGKKAGKEDNFDMLQQILLSKIALDQQYKLKADLEDKIVRQVQVVDEKLEYRANDKGFAMQFYVPLYSRLFKEDDFEPMVFSVFSGLGIKEVDSWVKKNKKKVEAFAEKAIAYLNEIKYTRVLNEPDRKNAAVRYYYENGVYLGKGNYNVHDKTVDMTGPWEFYFPLNGLVKAKGNFNSSFEKEGEWTYYYNTGKIKEKAFYKNGKLNGQLEGWFTNGNKWYTYNYTDGKMNGVSTGYFYNGLLRKTSTYKEDKKNGVEKGYSSTGYLQYVGNYADDEQEGMLTYYYSNGNKQDEVSYAKGKAQGVYKSYYKDGKPETQGEFTDDKKEGLWTTWYNSGAVKEKTTYSGGEITGEFTEYYENGKLERKGNYTKKKIDGKLEDYTDEGKLYSDATYEKGKLREINFYDAKGNNISTTSTRKGAADITFFTPEGIKSSQGYFNRDGNKDGEFTEFYASGKVSERTNFKDGIKEGEHVSYFSNGQKNVENTFKSGDEDGYTKGYFYNGKLNYEGWIVENDKQQDIIFYNQMGNIKSKEYYLNNELDGYSEYYYPGNVKDCDYRYHNGWLEEIVQYDSTGKELYTSKFEKGRGQLIFKHHNGKNMVEGNYNNYMLNGSYKTFFFDGTLHSQSFYKNDERDSVFKSYFYGGLVQSEGRYVNGEKQGSWKYYFDNGKLSEEEMYKDGKLEGVDKIYNRDGSLDKVGNYKNNQLEGEYTFYGENGQVAVVLNYKKGDLKSYTYEDKAGNKVPPVMLKGSTGKINGFYKNGNPSAEINYLNNDVEGVRKFYYSNGKPFVDGTRQFGYDDGVKKIYYPSGTLWKEEHYVLGNQHGISKWYYPNGKLEREENYYNSDLHGTCKYYDEQGKLKQTRTFYYDILLSVQ
ncbi:tetratricopeptide repeat protein [Ferruginibacter sp.]